MNLPATAPEFLDAFRGFTNTTLPRIHLYCFAPKPTTSTTTNGESDPTPSTTTTTTEEKEVDAGVIQRCSTALGCPIDAAQHRVSIRIVRDVSPKKNMVCISFDLPNEVRQLPRVDTTRPRNQEAATSDDEDEEGESNEPEMKRART